ncbi:hypothetical protein G7054_g7161 [Neopestalotiopsis clavispora]|nr:hypothetical protein G7054_g7161 [Neopestalotiopsis clavispora]
MPDSTKYETDDYGFLELDDDGKLIPIDPEGNGNGAESRTESDSEGNGTTRKDENKVQRDQPETKDDRRDH